mgnify:FL=1|tara:strand:+ start:583 stop:1128 length:546 start_codon:yes stop_codon:yes gene_type:complete
MQSLDLFPTTIWATKVELDNNKLEEDIRKFSSVTESVQVSNVGGYQGHQYENKELVDIIEKNVPAVEGKSFPNGLVTHTWANINPKGSYNTRHSHVDTQVLLSGTYYVKTPENSGRIRFYDPRGHLIPYMPDYEYYYHGHSVNYIQPEEGMVLYFPPWLDHDVEDNESEEDRISVSFNILW